MTSNRQVFRNPISLTQNPYESVMYTDEVAYRQRPVAGEPKRFPYDDWDMEVVFTRKAKPTEVGDLVRSPSGASMCVVAGIDGDEVWLRFDDGSHCTFDKDRLIYAS